MREDRDLENLIAKHNIIPEEYKSDIKIYKKWCKDSGFSESLSTVVSFLKYSLEVIRVKKTTWERRLCSLNKYFNVEWKLNPADSENFRIAIESLRKEYATDEYFLLKKIEGVSGVDKPQLISVLDDLPVREKAIAYVNLITANRPSEMVRMKIEDFDLEELSVRVYLKKQKTWHTKRLTKECANAVSEYIEVYQLKPTDHFVGRTYKSGRYENKQITEVGYAKFVKKLLGFPPYAFRKTQISSMHEAGADLSTISKQTGIKCGQTIHTHYLEVSNATVDKFI